MYDATSTTNRIFFYIEIKKIKSWAQQLWAVQELTLHNVNK